MLLCEHSCEPVQVCACVIPCKRNWLVWLQLLNTTCLLAGNAYLLAHPCGWFGGHQSAIAFLRFTAFNTDLFLLQIMCSSMQPWTDHDGESSGHTLPLKGTAAERLNIARSGTRWLLCQVSSRRSKKTSTRSS